MYFYLVMFLFFLISCQAKSQNKTYVCVDKRETFAETLIWGTLSLWPLDGTIDFPSHLQNLNNYFSWTFNKVYV